MRRGFVRCLWLALPVAFAISCVSWRLASLDALPAGQPLVGPDGTYELVPPTDRWVRLEGNEDNVDLSLARKSNDAWLNVQVRRNRYPSVDAAFVRARALAESVMNVVSRNEQDAVVPSPNGVLPARTGEYCGSFDRELSRHDDCFVIRVTQYENTSYALVGRLRMKDSEPGRKAELIEFVKSFRVTGPE